MDSKTLKRYLSFLPLGFMLMVIAANVKGPWPVPGRDTHGGVVLAMVVLAFLLFFGGMWCQYRLVSLLEKENSDLKARHGEQGDGTPDSSRSIDR